MGRPLNRPAALLPTPLGLVCLRQQSASDAILGVGKVLLGPEAVIIYRPGHGVFAALVSNTWSVAGDPLQLG